MLLSPDALTSTWVRAETRYALARSQSSGINNVIPVLVGDREDVLDKLPLGLSTIQYFDLTSDDFDERIQQLIKILKTREI